MDLQEKRETTTKIAWAYLALLVSFWKPRSFHRETKPAKKISFLSYH